MNELKAIARDLGVEPTGDRRSRETWEQAIEIQAQALTVEAAEKSLDVESKFGRIVYPQPTQKPIAASAETESKVSQSAIALGVFELVPESPDPLDFAGWSFYEAMWAYYERYPYWKYRDGKFPFNNKIFLGTEVDPEIEDSPAGETNLKMSQNAIAQTAENSINAGVDRPKESIEIQALALPEDSSDILVASPGVEIQALALLESSDTKDTSPGVEIQALAFGPVKVPTRRTLPPVSFSPIASLLFTLPRSLRFVIKLSLTVN